MARWCVPAVASRGGEWWPWLKAIRTTAASRSGPPLRDRTSASCTARSADEAREGCRLGGLGWRERTVEAVIRCSRSHRLVEVAAIDTLGLENSIARARTLAYLAQTATPLRSGDGLKVEAASFYDWNWTGRCRWRRSWTSAPTRNRAIGQVMEQNPMPRPSELLDEANVGDMHKGIQELRVRDARAERGDGR